jgi:hypothetical protein
LHKICYNLLAIQNKKISQRKKKSLKIKRQKRNRRSKM